MPVAIRLWRSLQRTEATPGLRPIVAGLGDYGKQERTLRREDGMTLVCERRGSPAYGLSPAGVPNRYVPLAFSVQPTPGEDNPRSGGNMFARECAAFPPRAR